VVVEIAEADIPVARPGPDRRETDCADHTRYEVASDFVEEVTDQSSYDESHVPRSWSKTCEVASVVFEVDN
jgi:hypothetical protein